MGSLGSLGLVFGWMINPQIPKSESKRNWEKIDLVGGWNAIAASSKYGLGLLATGAPLKLLESISSSSDFHQRPNCMQDGRHSSSKQHWASWLHSPLTGNKGGIGSPSDWSLGILMSRPWRSWCLGQGGPTIIGRGKVFVAGLGGGHGGNPADSTDKGYPSRTLTTIILGVNILVFLGQVATKGRILLWGAKVNALINEGQLWRLLTPSVLHANIFHLLVNSYSLNSIGPTVESLAGPKRFLAVYSVSALASTSLSYFCCAAPSVGASGAIFGLVGALAVFLVRHKNMMVGGQQSLQQVARVIAINLVLGLVTDGIDNWSHVLNLGGYFDVAMSLPPSQVPQFGGLFGGAAVTWLLGPVYTFEMPPGGGQRQLVDRPPISYLLPVQIRRKP